MRQLFTNIPSIKTEQEPHSPSPQPSFVPVNPSSCRRTSRRRSIGYTCMVSGFPFTVREISHFALCNKGWFILALGALRPQSRASHFRKERRRCPLEATELNGRKFAEHLRWR